ncbi:MAG: transcription termination/antitermination protein NusA [Hydrogenibacillus schlegelii]|nr:transcription termination/antitermination protein NusA [Hydrogenibacillus schlegelii]
MRVDFMSAIEDLEREKGIDKAVLIEAIKQALIAAYKKNYNTAQNVRVEIDEATGRIRVLAQKTVVEAVEDPRLEIDLDSARRIHPAAGVGDIIEEEVTPKDFGRVAAQTAKNVVTQRIREVERGLIYQEYAERETELIIGLVQRIDGKNVYVELGKTEGILPFSDLLPGDVITPGERIKAVIVRVERGTKGPQIFLSRTDPQFLRRLFEREVPEIYDGTVEIKAIAREPGDRSKVAVFARDPNVDPIGACVGPRGSRVQAIVDELGGEKIDIVRWSKDPAEFVKNALSPAKVSAVTVQEGDRTARVVVPDNQLSLAIGKKGQNARLAAKLTGLRIDIKSETQMRELAESASADGSSVKTASPAGAPADEAPAEGTAPGGLSNEAPAPAPAPAGVPARTDDRAGMGEAGEFPPEGSLAGSAAEAALPATPAGGEGRAKEG